MEDIIQIARGAKARLPALPEGVLGYCTDTVQLYIGAAGGNKLLTYDDGAVRQLITALAERVSALESARMELQTAVSALRGTVTSQQAEIAALQGSYTALEGRVAALEGTRR